jgi:hypothetical protein
MAWPISRPSTDAAATLLRTTACRLISTKTVLKPACAGRGIVFSVPLGTTAETPGSLTIEWEERETWTAESLRASVEQTDAVETNSGWSDVSSNNSIDLKRSKRCSGTRQ